MKLPRTTRSEISDAADALSHQALGADAHAALRAGPVRVCERRTDRGNRAAAGPEHRCKSPKRWRITRCCVASPPGKYHVQVCTNVSCMLRGGNKILEFVERKLEIGNKEVTKDGVFSLEEVECIGACTGAPAMQVNYDFYENLTPETLDQIIDGLDRGRKAGADVARLGLGARATSRRSAAHQPPLRNSELEQARRLSEE